MKIRINGEEYTYDSERTVAELVDERMSGQSRGVAIAINDMVVPKSSWAETRISDGDRIEIVRATQGG